MDRIHRIDLIDQIRYSRCTTEILDKIGGVDKQTKMPTYFLQPPPFLLLLRPPLPRIPQPMRLAPELLIPPPLLLLFLVAAVVC